ncbi:TonB-dependent receptor [Compostibacter hankyongensis]|uniref:TonB-dependent receptor n=1 Tax=Compostibacter hankyongensis TaxID=1007089 RepID=A0ABP8FK63_9BACT
MKKNFRYAAAKGCRYAVLISWIITAAVAQSAAKENHTQKPDPEKIFLSLEIARQPLEAVFRDIEKKTPFHFFYNASSIDIQQLVSLQVSRKSVTWTLLQLSGETGLEFEQINNAFSVRPARPAPPRNQAAEARARQQETAASPQPGAAPALPADTLIKGMVTDSRNTPLAGATIQIKGTALGAVTDAKGQFSLRVPLGATLVFSSVGYEPQTVTLSGKFSTHVALLPNAKGLSEVVVVGYGTQKKTSVTAAVSSVGGDEIVKAPVANVSNTLGGRVSGVLFRQNSGEPGSDADEIHIRGIGTTGNAGPLVVVDGIPMNYNQLNPNEVASITVLKDAAAVAPYGLAGANGVILVTTKRGKAGTFAFNYDGYYGFQQPTAIPEYLDAYGYASALNTANKNVGLPAAYTDEQLQKFRDGSDPDHYPNTDWVHRILNFQAPMTRHTLSFTGGTQKVRIYSNLGYLYQEGVVKVINFKRYNMTVNVDADVTPTTTVSLDINAALTKSHKPGGASGKGIFTDVTEIPPIFPLQYSNGQPAHQMLPSLYESGYNKDKSNIFNGKLQIEQRIPFVPGLSLKGVYAYNKSYHLDKAWQLPLTFYSLDASDQLVPQHAGPPTPTLSEAFGEGQQITMQGYVTYHRTFGKHDISLLGVYENRPAIFDTLTAARINYAVNMDELSLGSSDKNDFDNGGSSAKGAQIGWVYRLSYAYAGKYLAELTGRYDGHYYFAPGKRYAFFPAASLGWLLSEEPFLRDNFSWIDNLKLRGSYGKSGNLAGGPFQYLTAYGLGSSYVFGGTAPYQVQGIFENAQPNPNITWETAKKADIGLDALLWNGKLGFSLDYFREKRSDMLLKPTATVPAEYGIGISQVNAGVMENAGIDFSVTTEQRLTHDLRLNAAFNFTYARNKLIQTFETPATYNNPNRRQTGRPLDTRFGLESLGLYQQSDFDADGNLKEGEAVPTYGPVAPGDIKYADLAGPAGPDGKPTGPDGKIDINDYTVIGKPLFPEIIFGLNADLSWKGLSLSMLWQGAAGADIYLGNELAYPFFNRAKIAKYQMDYWTPDHTDAAFPRLVPSVTTNNSQESSFWVRNGTYLRLKTLELGYALPPAVLETIKLKSVRVYLSGQNLLTIRQFKYMDPELGDDNRGRYYYQQKVYAFGLNIGF